MNRYYSHEEIEALKRKLSLQMISSFEQMQELRAQIAERTEQLAVIEREFASSMESALAITNHFKTQRYVGLRVVWNADEPTA